MYLRGEGGLRVESKPWRERERAKKETKGGDGIEGWAEDGKEGRASCSSVTRILVPGEAERRSAQTFAGAFFSAEGGGRKMAGTKEGRGRKIQGKRGS